MKALIVYYSRTGNTKAVADRIQSRLNLPIQAIELVHPLTPSYDELVETEKRNDTEDSAVDIHPIDLSDFDTVIVGGPTWWYSVCPAVKTFLKTHDFAGKTVYPFVTNGGWVGHSLSDFKRLAKGADVKPGLDISIPESSSGITEAQLAKIDQWAERIH